MILLYFIVKGRYEMDTSNQWVHPEANISGGARTPHFKNTAESPTVIMPAPRKIVLPMQQHIGAPCTPVVAVGDHVKVGQLIGDSDKPVSAPIHSGVSGKVVEIKPFKMANGATCDCVVIESDGKMEIHESVKPQTVNTPAELTAAARNCGLVGLGGAGFPAHIKLSPSPQHKIDTLIINAAECEPFITSDYRECMESTEDILNGLYLIKQILGIEKVVIGVESNKPKAIDTMLRIATDIQDMDDTVKVMKLKSRYPQGAEKVLIYTVTGRKLPLGKLPADVGCIVMNVTSVAVLYRYITTGMPLTTKRITVDGSAIANPQNVNVVIGTPIQDVIDFCGGFKAEPGKILYGGPMMGICVVDTESPVMKQNNAILAFDQADSAEPASTSCISCGRCVGACPMNLTPAFIESAYNHGNLSETEKLGVNYCIECGSCAFGCPARRPLTQTMRLAKAALRSQKR